METEIIDNDKTLKGLSEKFAALKKERESLEDQLELVKAKIKALGDELLPVMRKEDIEKFTTSMGTVYIRNEEFAKIEDQEKAFAFFRDQGAGDIIKETIHSKTLTATFKELREAGKIDAFSCGEKGLAVFMKESVVLLKN